MKMRYLGLIAATLLVPAAAALADEEKTYDEGVVLDVTSIRTKPGMFDAYMKWLSTVYKANMEAEKKAGLIVNYAIYSALPHGPNDPDLYLVTTFKNFGAMDGLEDKLEPIYKKVYASRADASKAEMDRESMREVLGDEIIRELKLK
jgi:hypothetical protein